jgi:hypothetical protein
MHSSHVVQDATDQGTSRSIQVTYYCLDNELKYKKLRRENDFSIFSTNSFYSRMWLTLLYAFRSYRIINNVSFPGVKLFGSRLPRGCLCSFLVPLLLMLLFFLKSLPWQKRKTSKNWGVAVLERREPKYVTLVKKILVRSEVLKAGMWVVTTCGFVDCYQCFWKQYVKWTTVSKVCWQETQISCYLQDAKRQDQNE